MGNIPMEHKHTDLYSITAYIAGRLGGSQACRPVNQPAVGVCTVRTAYRCFACAHTSHLRYIINFQDLLGTQTRSQWVEKHEL